jgi:2Fe-2S ferredoxin
MPKVTFIEADGSVYEGEAEEGKSLMQAAQKLDVPGVVAECGGMCACSTCHCYVDPAWLDKLEPRSRMEDGMLEAAVERASNSRLTCQLPVDSSLDGIVLRVPPEQR